MRYLKNYNNMELITEARWHEIAVSRGDYNRDDEIAEFFLELTDLGGRIVRLTTRHTITDGNFDVKNRINYVNDPLYYTYTLRLKFEDVASAMVHGNIDVHMEKACDFFNELDDALLKIRDFGYKFKIKKFNFDPTSPEGINFDIAIYNVEDVVPWEHIFAPYEQ